MTWKVITAIISAFAIAVGAVSATASAVGNSRSVHEAQTDTLLVEERTQTRVLFAQLCVATRPRPQWSECLSKIVLP